MIKIKIDLQQLEDLTNFFIPLMIRGLESRIAENKGNDFEMLYRVSLSVLKDVHRIFRQKELTVARTFKITLTEAQALILMKLLLQFPLRPDDYWRLNLRNHIVELLDRQL